jgi:hypothetical protein
MRHSVSKLPVLSSTCLWMASTARAWKSALIRTGDDLPSQPANGISTLEWPPTNPRLKSDTISFRTYCELEGIAASINEARALGALTETSSHLELSLLHFHRNYLKLPSASMRDPFCLDILWHVAYISLFADLDRLELAAGREGYEKSQSHMAYVKEWARSPAARRCALHGMMILQQAEHSPIGTEPAIHVPRALYSAAMVWYSYTEHGSDDAEDVSAQLNDYPEFDMLGIDTATLLFEAHGFRNTRPSKLESMTLVSLIDLLRRIGHLGISDRMATLLTSIVHGDPDGEAPVAGS